MRIGIIEDQVLYQKYLSTLVSQKLGYEVVLCTGDGESAFEACLERNVELLILDLKIHHIHGIELAKRLLQANPSLKILTYSVEVNDYNLRMVESLGILGFLDKSDPVMQSDDYVVQAIQSVVRGKKVCTPGVAALCQELSSNHEAFHKVLSPRKIEILRSVGQCFSDAEIAEEMKVSVHTIRKHRLEMIQQLNLDSTHSLIRYAQEHGFSNVGMS